MMILFAAALAQATPAQPLRAPQFDLAEYVVGLDAALADADYNAISEATLKPASALQAKASLDWLGMQFNRGASPMIALTYARLLGAVAQAAPGSSGDGLRGTALAAMIYAAAASSIDDRQCADRTAWGNRLQQMTPLLQQSGLLGLDDRNRRLAAAVALHIEKTTWETRKQADDAAFLCMNGMTAMTAGIAKGSVKEVNPREGQIGRQMSVKVPDGFRYERRSNSEWWSEAETLRAQLPALVLALANVDRLPTEDELRAGSSK